MAKPKTIKRKEDKNMKIKGVTLTKKRILGFTAMALAFSLVLAGTVSALTTGAWFFDTETSNGNNITAGSLDLKIDNDDVNAVKFEVDNMVPNNTSTPQLVRTYLLKNTGSIDGYLDLSSIVLTSFENGILDPEEEAGDTTDNKGELVDRAYLALFFDLNDDGKYFAADDYLVYNGKPAGLPTKKMIKRLMPAESELKLVAHLDWYPADYPPATPWTQDHKMPHLDNLAMGDSFTLDITFLLGQTPDFK